MELLLNPMVSSDPKELLFGFDPNIAFMMKHGSQSDATSVIRFFNSGHSLFVSLIYKIIMNKNYYENRLTMIFIKFLLKIL